MKVQIPRFVGVDGEGFEIDGRHEYILLRAGNEVVSSSTGLASNRCLAFLAGLSRSATYVAFAFNYDVTKILGDIPFWKLKRLCERHKRVRRNGGVWPVEHDGYEFDWLPTKFFKVRRKGQKRYVVINDVWGFFQGSFNNALSRWSIGSEEERKKIALGKSQRSIFAEYDLDYIDKYNELEIQLLQELMSKFATLCRQVGYVPSNWQGAGQLAEAIYAKHGHPYTRDISNVLPEVWQAGRECYYGGRFEQAYFGSYSDTVWQSDINSAYPHAMLSPAVPCLIHSEWKPVPQGTSPSSLNDIAMLHVRSTIKDDALYYGLPCRHLDGSIRFPGALSGWYWSFEVEQAIHQNHEVLGGWEYVRRCTCSPFRFVRDLYEERKRIGKDGRGMVLKLGLNSLYGKMAQSIGSPKYANAIHASFITAHCRTAISRMIHSLPSCKEGHCGEDVLFIATDSIATTRMVHTETSSEIGGWSVETLHDLLLVQPGFYFEGRAGQSRKTRGLSKRTVDGRRHEFDSAWRNMYHHAEDIVNYHINFELYSVPIQTKVFCGLKTSTHRNRKDILGQWVDHTHRATFNWLQKRSEGIKVGNGLVKTLPWANGGASIGYTKNIGGLYENEAMITDQPDWIRH